MIILDFGSGGTCRNEWEYAKKMIDTLAGIDKERKCIIKWQLFERAGKNIPLSQEIFYDAKLYAEEKGFQTTASVFDKRSLNCLLDEEEVPFVKIANRRDLDWLIGEIPRKIKVLVSVTYEKEIEMVNADRHLCCVSDYPAETFRYQQRFSEDSLRRGISDHTTNWKLFYKYEPQWYECHFCLDDSIGLDAGPFARRPYQLKEIL